MEFAPGEKQVCTKTVCPPACVHADRTAGGHRRHRHSGGDAFAGAGAEPGKRRVQPNALTTLRQWGLAYRLYADDNDDFLPRRGQGVQVLAEIDRPADWFNALPVYFGLSSVSTDGHEQCERLPPTPNPFSFVRPPDDPGGTYFLPYGMNMNLCPWNLPVATKFGEVVQPSCVVAMADAPGLMPRRIRPSSLTASSRVTPGGSICCSLPVRCNPSPVRMWAAARVIPDWPMCAGSPARPAMPAPTIIDEKRNRL